MSIRMHNITVGFRIIGFALFLSCLTGNLPLVSSVSASQFAKPVGKVILSISGKIAHQNVSDEFRFDRDMLKAIGMRELTTRSYEKGQVATWRGILVKDLLGFVGAKGVEVEAIALDNYRMVIPRWDFDNYDVILALEKDGQPLTVRTRGPTRIIYPYDQHAELQTPEYGVRLVWQIKKLVVK